MEKKRNAPINTEITGPMPGLPSLIKASAMGDAGITAQEKRGQQSFVKSDTLPTQMSSEDKSLLEKGGVKFLGEVPHDPLFQFVELPEGWLKKPTDHDMWSELFDSRGRKVASIFYKAAFYDRSAHLSLEREWKP